MRRIGGREGRGNEGERGTGRGRGGKQGGRACGKREREVKERVKGGIEERGEGERRKTGMGGEVRKR